jgi:FAD:protein FMN transferase
MTHHGWPCILPLLLLLAATPRAGPLHRFEAVEPHMGTLVRILVYAPDADTARAAHRAGFDRIRALEAMLSDYQPNSELNRLTATPAGTAVRVSGDLLAVLKAAQDLSHATDGAFDVTQGPVIRLWREARRTGRLPDASALTSASARTGFTRMRLDEAARTVTLDVDDMALDLGGIGKGYAASEALAAIGHAGVSRALVAVSGDLAFSDAPPGQHGWRVGVHTGDPVDGPLHERLELTHAAVSTSGADAQHLEVDGRRYSHIVDPSTATGLEGGLVVTVIAPHGVEADGLATAISVLGVERGLALVESRPPVAALTLERVDGTPHVRRSARFPRPPTSRGDGPAAPRGH